mmetsp:Transcript_20231/g.53914  ORF Transcript_20231/g.53914 Transcript_20231/m.53914 type:complete len:155 (-) Transcript_20231:212-676(-)
MKRGFEQISEDAATTSLTDATHSVLGNNEAHFDAWQDPFPIWRFLVDRQPGPNQSVEDPISEILINNETKKEAVPVGCSERPCSSSRSPTVGAGGKTSQQIPQKEKNRLAAKKSRDSAKIKMEQLEEQLHKAQKENTTLREFILKNFKSESVPM